MYVPSMNNLNLLKLRDRDKKNIYIYKDHIQLVKLYNIIRFFIFFVRFFFFFTIIKGGVG